MKQGDSCCDCPYLEVSHRDDFMAGIDDHWCGHFDVLELDTNEPGLWVGFLPVAPAECPRIAFDDVAAHNRCLSEHGEKMRQFLDQRDNVSV